MSVFTQVDVVLLLAYQGKKNSEIFKLAAGIDCEKKTVRELSVLFETDATLIRKMLWRCERLLGDPVARVWMEALSRGVPLQDIVDNPKVYGFTQLIDTTRYSVAAAKRRGVDLGIGVHPEELGDYARQYRDELVDWARLAVNDELREQLDVLMRRVGDRFGDKLDKDLRKRPRFDQAVSVVVRKSVMKVLEEVLLDHADGVAFRDRKRRKSGGRVDGGLHLYLPQARVEEILREEGKLSTTAD
jgi:hypothetical protein